MDKAKLIFLATMFMGLAIGTVIGVITERAFIKEHTLKCEETLEICAEDLERCRFRSGEWNVKDYYYNKTAG